MVLLKLSLPLYVELPRKTKANVKFYLNLNKFRNSHHSIMNNAKKAYKEVVLELLRAWSVDKLRVRNTKVRLTYTLYPKTKRRMDLANILPAVQKFTDDALVELGVLEDDDYQIISHIDYRFGKIDKLNPRAELVMSVEGD